jgi:hypothetical protein
VLGSHWLRVVVVEGVHVSAGRASHVLSARTLASRSLPLADMDPGGSAWDLASQRWRSRSAATLCGTYRPYLGLLIR